MSRPRKSFPLPSIAGLALLAVVVDAPSIHADPQRCQRAISAELAKYVQSVVTAVARCEDRRVSGTLPAATVCATEPGTSARVTKADARLRGRITKACGGGDRTCGTGDDDTLASIGWNVGQCPDLRDAGCDAPIGDCADIGECLACVGMAAARQSAGLASGSLAAGEFGTRSSLNRCQRAIGKETARFFRTAARALGRCWGNRLRGTHANACPTPGDGRAGPVIAAAEARKVSRICAACGGADGTCGAAGDFTPAQIGFPASCPDVTVPSGAACAAPVAALQALVDCVDCVTEFDAECAARLAVPGLVPYPAACKPTTTTTTTSTTTSTTMPVPCPPPPPIPLGSVTVTIRPGSTDCGAVQLAPGASPPLSGEVLYLDGTKRADLGLACLYTGGGNAVTPPFGLPDGAQSVLDVAGVEGLAFTVTASDGTGPADCTKGAGPGRHCLNGASGTDGQGTCASDADCGGTAGACDLDANCFFLNPIPVPVGGTLAACVMNAVATDVCGAANLITNETSLSVNVSSRIYVRAGAPSPCPQCLDGACTFGQRAGQPCSGGVGSKNTTIECPPSASTFTGKQAISFSGLTNGTAEVTSPTGLFCPGQVGPGAFGGEAGTIREVGSPLFSGGGGLLDTTFAGILCVPSTGSSFFDSVSGLPGPAAVSVPVTLDINIPLLGLP